MTLVEATGVSCDRNVIAFYLVIVCQTVLPLETHGCVYMQFLILLMLNFNFARQTHGLKVNLFCPLGIWHRKDKVDKVHKTGTEISCYNIIFFLSICPSDFQ